MVEFSVALRNPKDGSPKVREVKYAARFVNEAGEQIELTKRSLVHAPFFEGRYTTAWLFSHVLEDFMRACESRQAAQPTGFPAPGEGR